MPQKRIFVPGTTLPGDCTKAPSVASDQTTFDAFIASE